MQDFQEFFQFSFDIFNWRFFTILICLCLLGRFLPLRWTKTSRSVRFNIWLFFVIATASAIGTFIPQNKPPHEAVAKFGAFWASVFDKLGFFDIYHTWWFGGLLALMAFNVVACKLRNLPKIIFGPPQKNKLDVKGSLSQIFHRASFREDFKSGKDVEQASQSIQSWIKKRKYQMQKGTVLIDKKEKGIIYYAGRHYAQRWGDFILHVSIVGILAGNLLGALVGYEEAIPVMEGSKATTQKGRFEIELKDFEIDYYQSTGVPSLFASDLVVRQQGKVVGEKRIVVNDPLDVEGVRFYQASWGMTDQFRSAKFFVAGEILELKQGEAKTIQGLPFQIRANALSPTFDLDENRRPITRDYEGQNPAIQVDFLKKEEVIGRIWILKNRPEMAFRMVHGVAHPTRPPDVFQFLDVDPILFSGIQVGYDPGAAIFWTFSLILLFGLCVHFYFHQRRLRILILPRGKGTTIYLGGWNSRSPYDFYREFQNCANELRNRLKE